MSQDHPGQHHTLDKDPQSAIDKTEEKPGNGRKRYHQLGKINTDVVVGESSKLTGTRKSPPEHEKVYGAKYSPLTPTGNDELQKDSKLTKKKSWFTRLSPKVNQEANWPKSLSLSSRSNSWDHQSPKDSPGEATANSPKPRQTFVIPGSKSKGHGKSPKSASDVWPTSKPQGQMSGSQMLLDSVKVAAFGDDQTGTALGISTPSTAATGGKPSKLGYRVARSLAGGLHGPRPPPKTGEYLENRESPTSEVRYRERDTRPKLDLEKPQPKEPSGPPTPPPKDDEKP